MKIFVALRILRTKILTKYVNVHEHHLKSTFPKLFYSENGKLCSRSGSFTVKMATHCLYTCMTFSRVRQFINMISKLVVYLKKKLLFNINRSWRGGHFHVTRLPLQVSCYFTVVSKIINNSNDGNWYDCPRTTFWNVLSICYQVRATAAGYKNCFRGGELFYIQSQINNYKPHHIWSYQ